MKPWVEAGLRAAVQGTLLAFVVLSVTWAFRRLAPSVRCALWWLVLAEFALGWLVLAPVRFRAPEALSGVAATVQAPVQAASVQPADTERKRTEGSNAWIWATVWALGFCSALGYGALGTMKLARIRRQAVPADEQTCGEARRLAAELGLSARPSVLISQAVKSPATFGLYRPCLLLPQSFGELSATEREMALTHELAHILRRDGWLALVPELATAVFWFFPVAFLARRAWAVERELACDAVVCARPGLPPADYRRLLLKIVERDAVPLPRTALGATADFRCLRKRLTAAHGASGPLAKLGGALAFAGVAVLAVPVTLQPRTPNGGLLQNAGFEEGGGMPSAWATGERIDKVRYIWDDKVSRSGKRSACIDKKANRYFPIAEWIQMVPYDGKSPAVEFGAWIKAEKVTKAVLDVQFYTDEGIASHAWVAYDGAKGANDPAVTHDWKRFGTSVSIPPGTKQIGFALQDYGPGRVWFDDVSARFLAEAPKEPFKP